MSGIDKKVDIVLRAWGQMQEIAASCDKSATRVRVFGFSTWSALVAYGYTEDDAFIFVISVALLCAALIGEMWFRLIQYSFISRSFEVEKALDFYMADDEISFMNVNISTHIATPTRARFFSMLGVRRWAIWVPYVIAIGVSAIAFMIVIVR